MIVTITDEHLVNAIEVTIEELTDALHDANLAKQFVWRLAGKVVNQ